MMSVNTFEFSGMEIPSELARYILVDLSDFLSFIPCLLVCKAWNEVIKTRDRSVEDCLSISPVDLSRNWIAKVAQGGYLDLIKWARKSSTTRCPWDSYFVGLAAEAGHLKVLQWGKKHGAIFVLKTESTINPPFLCEFLEEDEETDQCSIDFWSDHVLERAVVGGHLNILKWAREELPDLVWEEWLYMFSASAGHFEILKWLRSQDPLIPFNELDGWTCSMAAAKGQVEILKWLRSQDPPFPWDEWTCAEAAKYGSLEGLKWLRENGCSWDEMTCSFAARFGHLEVLKWATENGCLWDILECKSMMEANKDEEMLKWLEEWLVQLGMGNVEIGGSIN
jgi:hypothetical protein